MLRKSVIPHFSLYTVPLGNRRLVEMSGARAAILVTQLVLVFKKLIYAGEDSDGGYAAASVLAHVKEVSLSKHPQCGRAVAGHYFS